MNTVLLGRRSQRKQGLVRHPLVVTRLSAFWAEPCAETLRSWQTSWQLSSVRHVTPSRRAGSAFEWATRRGSRAWWDEFRGLGGLSGKHEFC